MRSEQRLFLSAVSSEFGDHRAAVAKDIRKTGAVVEDQDQFRSRGGQLLQLLDDYIRECAAVVHLIGGRYGYVAKEAEVTELLHKYPDFLSRFPQLTDLAPQLSYTQWEAWLALYHGKRLHLFLHGPVTPADRDPVQQRHLELLQERGHHWPSFKDREDLRTQVLIALRDILPDGPRVKPINLPFGSIGSLFKGREDFLGQLREVLVEKPTHIAAVTGKQAIHGLGGVGKTRAAIEYGWKYAHEYTALLFVTADSPENLMGNLAGLCGAMVLNLPEQAAQEQSAQVAAAVRWLREHSSWFLILDNVDTPAAAQAVEWQLARLTSGHVVVTSRLADWGAGVEPLALDVLDNESAASFLLERTADKRRVAPTDEADARALAEDLDGLSLALEQAGAFVAKHRLRFADYRQRWKAQEAKVLEWFDEREMKYPRSVAMTWQTSIGQLGEDGRRLLNVLCWLAPDPIPREMVEGLTLPDGEPPLDVEAALADLTAHSLARWQDGGDALLVHRLVEEITHYRIPPEDRPLLAQSALLTVNRYFPYDSDDVRFWPACEAARPHADLVLRHAESFGSPPPAARLLNQLALYLNGRAEHAAAEPLLRRALAIAEASLGPDHPDVAACLDNLAGLLRATDRLGEAEPLTRRALAIDEASLGPDHPDVATHLNNLAGLLRATDRPGEAEPLMRRALAIDEATLGPDHPNVAIRLNNLAGLLRATNRPGEAEPLMRRHFEIFCKFTRTTGHQHPRLKEALGNWRRLLAELDVSDQEKSLRISAAGFNPAWLND